MDRWSRLVGVLVFSVFAAGGCSDQPTAPGPAPLAVLQFDVRAIAGTRLIAVEVTGPGIDTGLVFNVAVDSVTRMASGTVRIPAGAGRRLLATAFDVSGVATHRGDTTLTLTEGVNPSVNLVLRSLNGSVPVVITFGGVGITITPGDTTLAVDDTVRFSAAGLDSLGATIPAGAFAWSSTAPGVVGVSTTGLARARASGTAFVLATHGGVSTGRRVVVP